VFAEIKTAQPKNDTLNAFFSNGVNRLDVSSKVSVEKVEKIISVMKEARLKISMVFN